MSASEWDISNYEQTPYGVRDIRPEQGNGDWICNTCLFIMETKDESEWAIKAFVYCQEAIYEKKRWPDEADKWVTANRSQYSVTRDCYIYFYACSQFLFQGTVAHNLDLMIKIPWWLYRPSVFAWRKYLLKGYKWSLFIHKAGKWINGLFPQKEYVIRLTEYMDKAVKIKQDGKNLKR